MTVIIQAAGVRRSALPGSHLQIPVSLVRCNSWDCCSGLVRLHDARSGSPAVCGGWGKGWRGLAFRAGRKQMSAAIGCMHDDPAHRWTLQELAERAGMPRSIFALSFKETVGATSSANVSGTRSVLAMNPQAPSEKLSEGSWAVPHGNTAGATTRILLQIEQKKPSAPIGSKL